MSRKEKMFGSAPKMGKNDKGEAEITKGKIDKQEPEKKAAVEPQADGSMDAHDRHMHERREVKHRHMAEHHAMHHKHEMEHSMNKEGDKKSMHHRHHLELKEMHNKHENEHKSMHKRHEQDMGNDGQEMIDKIKKE